MLSDLFAAYVKDVLCVARTEGFFAMDAAERQKIIQSVLGKNHAKAIREYLRHVTQDEFKRDLALLVPRFASSQVNLLSMIQTIGSSNQLADSFSHFLSEVVGPIFDQGQTPRDGMGQEALGIIERWIERGRVAEVAQEIRKFIHLQSNIASPVIQSPHPLDAAQKTSMREQLLKQYPGSFPTFEVESTLGGGLRLFYEGTLTDESWVTQAFQVVRHSPAS